MEVTVEINELKRLMRELVEQQKETDKQLKETGKLQKETDKVLTEKFKETDKILTDKFKETDKILSDKFKETDKKIKELAGLFTSQWGILVESLVEGDLVNILNERGIQVISTTQRRKGNYQGESFEYDIIAHNGIEIVIVEVKTKLRPGDVKKFIEKLNKVKTYLPEFANFKVMGAMAFLKADAGAEVMVEKRGLFVIKATGDSAAIINQSNFKPRIF